VGEHDQTVAKPPSWLCEPRDFQLEPLSCWSSVWVPSTWFLRKWGEASSQADTYFHTDKANGFGRRLGNAVRVGEQMMPGKQWSFESVSGNLNGIGIFFQIVALLATCFNELEHVANACWGESQRNVGSSQEKQMWREISELAVFFNLAQGGKKTRVRLFDESMLVQIAGCGTHHWLMQRILGIPQLTRWHEHFAICCVQQFCQLPPTEDATQALRRILTDYYDDHRPLDKKTMRCEIQHTCKEVFKKYEAESGNRDREGTTTVDEKQAFALHRWSQVPGFTFIRIEPLLKMCKASTPHIPQKEGKIDVLRCVLGMSWNRSSLSSARQNFVLAQIHRAAEQTFLSYDDPGFEPEPTPQEEQYVSEDDHQWEDFEEEDDHWDAHAWDETVPMSYHGRKSASSQWWDNGTSSGSWQERGEQVTDHSESPDKWGPSEASKATSWHNGLPIVEEKEESWVPVPRARRKKR
jgi:hypothetical protein